MCVTGQNCPPFCFRRAMESLGCFVAAALLLGCQQQPSSLTTGRGEAKPEYQEAVAAVKKLGVEVRVDDQGEVTYLDFYGARDVPAAIVYVEKFPHLKMLNFSSTNLSDAEMEHLAGATELEELGLHGTQITDAGLVPVAGLKRLRVLNLNDTQVGDEGLAHLSGLTRLEQIRLQSTRVTDAGLSHLTPLENLVVVWLSGSQVTAEGVARLQQSLPEAEIVNQEIIDRSDEPLLPASAFEQ